MSERLLRACHASGLNDLIDLSKLGALEALTRFAQAVADDCAASARLVPKQDLYEATPQGLAEAIARTITQRWSP